MSNRLPKDPTPIPPELKKFLLSTLAMKVSSELQEGGYTTAVQYPLVLEICVSMASEMCQMLAGLSAEMRDALIKSWLKDVLAYREFILSQPEHPGNPEEN